MASYQEKGLLTISSSGRRTDPEAMIATDLAHDDGIIYHYYYYPSIYLSISRMICTSISQNTLAYLSPSPWLIGIEEFPIDQFVSPFLPLVRAILIAQTLQLCILRGLTFPDFLKILNENFPASFSLLKYFLSVPYNLIIIVRSY